MAKEERDSRQLVTLTAVQDRQRNKHAPSWATTQRRRDKSAYSMHKHNDFCPLNTSHVVSIWMQFSSVLWLLKDDVNSNDPSRSPVEDVGTWHWIFNSLLYIPIFVHASLIEQFRFEATRNNWLMMLPYSVLASGQKDEHQLAGISGLSWAWFLLKVATFPFSFTQK